MQARMVNLLDRGPLAQVTDIGARAAQAKKGEFTAAERALIGRVGGFMPPVDLLTLLNERRLCDSPGVSPHTLEELQAELSKACAAVNTDNSWRALRKRLADARRAGVLASIDAQVVRDFAVVFSLNPKQVTLLKDTLLGDQK